MKFLKIEKNKGFYTIDKIVWNEIDTIKKEDLLKLIEYALSDEFEMDEFQKEQIANQAHQIIYKHIYEKLDELNKNKNRFLDEGEALYKEAIQKYSN